MIVPIHQDPRDLALTVVPGKLQTSLTVLKHRSISIGAWKLTFHIIGESHLVMVEHGQKPVFCELLACVKVNSEFAVHHHSFGDLMPHKFEHSGYSVQVDFDLNAHSLSPTSADHLLEMTFPNVEGTSPITQIMWRKIRGNRVQWQTLHLYAYHGDLISVRSLSYFDTLHYNPTTHP